MTKSVPTILITGSSSGIGRALAIHFSNSFNIVLHGQNEERLQETFASCAVINAHHKWVCNLNNLKDVEQSLNDLLVNKNISIDYFIANAGIIPVMPFRAISYDLVEKTLTVNAYVNFLITSMVRKYAHFRASILISSLSTKLGAKGFSIYAASKGILNTMIDAFSTDNDNFSKIYNIITGDIAKDNRMILDNAELTEKLNQHYPLGIGYPEDLTSMIDYLITAGNSIPSNTFILDGGLTSKF